ncbi:hypothetical protein EDD85DRAFT_958668 [Armillaria nabsnona]|nr:hypothetical protein EDD85DRAFT_958668 [Armillaria nabsnona]
MLVVCILNRSPRLEMPNGEIARVPLLDATLDTDYLPKGKKLYVSMVRDLNEINAKGVIYFDVRPANTIIMKDSQIVVIDFGQKGSDAFMAIDILLSCYDTHEAALQEWSDTGLPDGLLRPHHF